MRYEDHESDCVSRHERIRVEEVADRHIPASSIKIAKTAQFVVALRKSAMRRRGFQVPAIYHAFASATEQDLE